VRIVGYVRESSDPAEGPTAFAQQEEIRRYAARHGHALIAVCQDARTPGHPLGRTGYRSMLGILGTGEAEAVVVASLDALSGDTIVQEILLWDLRARRVRVLSASPSEEGLLGATPDPTRMLIRDVLSRVSQHVEELRGPADDDTGDVVVYIDEARTAR
jgi:DNA invertase Pin-like site-specific DNA recombinase